MPISAEEARRQKGAYYTSSGRLLPKYLPGSTPVVTRSGTSGGGFRPGMTAGGTVRVGARPSRPKAKRPIVPRPVVTSSGVSGGGFQPGMTAGGRVKLPVTRSASLSTRKVLSQTVQPSKSQAYQQFAQSGREQNRGIGGLFRNFGREAAAFSLSGGPLLQLAGEALAYPVYRTGEAAYLTATGQRPGIRSSTRIGRAMETHFARAGKGVVADYSYRYGPLVRGDLGTFGSRVYEAPLSFGLDAGGLYSATGRGAASGARAAARLSPNSRFGQAAARVGDRSILAPGEISPRTGLPTGPTGGRRYRPPQVITSGATDAPNAAFTQVYRHRRPYSKNLMTQAIQRRLADPLGARLTTWTRAKADAAQNVGYRPTFQGRMQARVSKPLTTAAAMDRAMRRGAREVKITAEANAERLETQLTRSYQTAARPLRKDLAARQTVALEMRGVLSPRAGLTRTQVRDLYVRKVQARQNELTAETGWQGAKSREQIADVAKIPSEYVELQGKTGAQIAAAANEGRKLSRRLQAMQVKVGAVSAEAAERSATRHEAVTLGGAQWGPRVVRQLRAESMQVFSKARQAAAEGADQATVAGLRDQARALRAKAEAVRADSVVETPQIRALRSELEDARQTVSSLVDARTAVRTGQSQAYRDAVARRAGLPKDTARSVYVGGMKAGAAKATLRKAPPAWQSRPGANVRIVGLRDGAPNPAVRPRPVAAAEVGRAAGMAPASKTYAVLRNELDAVAGGELGAQLERWGDWAGMPVEQRNGLINYLRQELEPGGMLSREKAVDAGEDLRTAHRVRAQAQGLLRKLEAIKPAREAQFRGTADVTPTGKNPKGTSGEVLTRPDAARQTAFGRTLEGESRLWRYNTRTKARAAAERDVTTARVDLARGTPKLDRKIASARRNARQLASQLRDAENASLGLTPPLEPQYVAGGRGIFLPEAPIDPLTSEVRRAFGGGSSGPGQSKQNTGLLAATGNWDIDMGLLMEQARRATNNYVGPRSPQALQELIGTAAYKNWVPKDLAGDAVVFAERMGADGNPEVLLHATGERARMLLGSDPDRVVLVNVGNLKRVLEKVDELPDGRYLDTSDVESVFYSEGDTWLDAIPEGALSEDYVAINRAAADVWRETMSSPGSFIGKYDAMMAWWKTGILALTPRWYLNGTVGMAFQFGVLSGPDLKAMVAAFRRGPLRDVVPAEIEGMTAVRDIGGDFMARTAGSESTLARLGQRGFQINNNLEGFWKRSAYISRSRKALKAEGVDVSAMDDLELARAIDEMPPTLQRQVIREVDLFIGDYRRMTKFERTVIRRIFPFYSWLRVISRLTFTMPFRHPLRTEAMMVLGKAAELGINADDQFRPLHRRGDMAFGPIRIPTGSMMPFATMAPFIQEATAATGPGDALLNKGIGLGFSWGTPPLQAVAQVKFGVDPFGNPIFAPPGYGGTASQFSGERLSIDPVTGLPRPVTVNRPWEDALLATLVPGQYGPLRAGLSAGETVYDTATLRDLIGVRLGGQSPEGVIYPRKTLPVTGPSGFGLQRVGVPEGLAQGIGAGVGSFLGIRAYRENPGRLVEDYNERWGRYSDAVKSTRKAQKRNARRAKRQG